MSILPVKLRRHNQRGFTLVESMVALVILTIAIIPALYLSNSAVTVAYNVRDDLAAAELAQEGVEVIRAIRDANWLNGVAFDTNLAAGSYRVEWNSTTPLALAGNPPLNLNNGLYTYVGGTPSKFTRMITITKVNAGELKVVSQVSWATRIGSRTTTVEDHLFNWK